VGDTCADVFGSDSVTLEIAPAVSPTPEPSSVLLMGTGFLAIGGYFSRKRAAAKGCTQI
jgi:hypothetical protein